MDRACNVFRAAWRYEAIWANSRGCLFDSYVNTREGKGGNFCQLFRSRDSAESN